jgi:osmoprotectant transport system substrate-binding protein
LLKFYQFAGAIGLSLRLLRGSRKTERGANFSLLRLAVRAAPFELLRNARKTECGANFSLLRLAVRAAPFALLCCGCGKSPKPILVGSQNSTAQILTGEIVAQHLEARLGRKIQRRLGAGVEALVYEGLLTGEISVYPTFTGSVETVILREPPASDPDQVWERSHGELSRTVKMELLRPLGYENPPAMVIQSAGAEASQAATLSQAAAAKVRWKIGVSYEFQQRTDGIPAISSYRLPMAQPIRGMDAERLFPALQKGDVNMIGADLTDAHLTSPDFRILADDKHAFPPYQACLLVRQDSLAAEPRLLPSLAELSGKFTTQGIRKMSAEVDLRHRQPADVAADFLANSGLQ